MSTRYPLAQKIKTLNLLDQLNGDRRQAAAQSKIPLGTLENWIKDEDKLRTQFTQQQDQQFDQRLSLLHLKLLDRALAILDHLDDATLADASAGQLANALNTVISHTVKLQELQNQNDQILANRQPTNIDFGQHAHTRPAPSQSTDNPAAPRPLQNRRLRTPMGQNPTRQNRHPGPRPAK